MKQNIIIFSLLLNGINGITNLTNLKTRLEVDFFSFPSVKCINII
jgi:hypothetical protein